MNAFVRRRLLWLAPLILLGSAVATWAFVIRKPADPDQVWRKAEEDFHAGAYDRAEQAVATLARLREPTSLDWMLRSQIAMKRGRTDEAIDDLAKIPDKEHLAAQARLMAGQLDLRRHRTRPAEEAFLDALELDPKLVQARRELIYLYGVQVRRKALGEQFLKLSETIPLTFDNVFHWCLTRNTVWEPLELTQIMGKFVEADPGDRWSRLTLAEAQRQLGHKNEAEATLKNLPASDPDARAIRVRLALDRGDEAGAEALLTEGPEDNPELARLRGRLALTRRDGKAALKHFRAAYAAEPDNRDTLFGLSSALNMVGDKKEAEEFANRAKNHDVLGTLMQRISVERNRQDPKLLHQLGAAFESINRLHEARAWYNLAISRDPLDKDAQEAIARLNAAIAASNPGKPAA